MVDSHDQKRGRLNCISHLLSLVPYHEVPHEKVKLPKRQPKGDYEEPNHPFRWVPSKVLRGGKRPWQKKPKRNPNGTP